MTAAVIAGCAAPPGETSQPRSSIESPSATGSTDAPPASVAPTQVPATTLPGPTVGVTWERLAVFREMGFAFDAVWGGEGWVGAGDCWWTCDDGAATAWFSNDATKWFAEALPRANDVVVEEVASNADGYVISAMDYDIGDVQEAFLQVWLSPNGRDWARVGELPLGSCLAGCPFVRGLGLAPSGAIVVGSVAYEDQPRSGPFVSDDGTDWTLLPPSAFGTDFLDVIHVESTPSAVFVLAFPCVGCALGVWTSTNGRDWTDAGEIDAPRAASASLAVDGDRRVATIMNCPGTRSCEMQAWTSRAGGPWTLTLDAPDIHMAEVASAGGAFVLVGLRPETYIPFTSADGSMWVELGANGLGSDDDCGVTWLAGGSGNVILGDPDCSIWLGTVQ